MHLVLFESEKNDLIYNSITYLVSVKTGITYFISHIYAKIKVDAYEFGSTFKKTIILIK